MTDKTKEKELRERRKVFSFLSKQKGYPCGKCGVRNRADCQKRCDRWTAWFRATWRAIRKNAGKEV